MALLCFVLDIRTVPPSVLEEWKELLHKLSNLYALTPGRQDLPDRIALCYLHKTLNSGYDELTIAYSPREKFSLRNFHSVVRRLPASEMINSQAAPMGDLAFRKLFSKEHLYSWGNEDTPKKVIFLGSCWPVNLDSLTRFVKEGVGKLVSMQFILLCVENTQESVYSISNLETFSCLLYNSEMAHELLKYWVQELNGNNKPLHAVITFRRSVTSSENIFCNLFTCVNQITETVKFYKYCACHGLPLDGSTDDRREPTADACPVTRNNLQVHDREQAIKVGEHTHLFFGFAFEESLRALSHITFCAIHLTKLSSLSEGATVGSRFYIAGASNEGGSTSQISNNDLCSLYRQLRSWDQGLVCSSNYNTETQRVASFPTLYLIQPSSEGGLLLLVRLAGSAEIISYNGKSLQYTESNSSDDTSKIRNLLLKMEVKAFTPEVHEEEFHEQVNAYVEYSMEPLFPEDNSESPRWRSRRRYQEETTSASANHTTRDLHHLKRPNGKDITVSILMCVLNLASVLIMLGCLDKMPIFKGNHLAIHLNELYIPAVGLVVLFIHTGSMHLEEYLELGTHGFHFLLTVIEVSLVSYEVEPPLWFTVLSWTVLCFGVLLSFFKLFESTYRCCGARKNTKEESDIPRVDIGGRVDNMNLREPFLPKHAK